MTLEVEQHEKYENILFVPSSGTYRVLLQERGRSEIVGYFSDLEAAIAARDAAKASKRVMQTQRSHAIERAVIYA